ncbi:hypothetical protein SAY86_000760 [Trapa natans]|uniref:Uncharacterized protein n=1 Tax=Trapa natans TaxID=22666 RepID=A0AAN7MCL5_TRANT|nr:hypothetical protein SAY86_000760 [Trapa natans]
MYIYLHEMESWQLQKKKAFPGRKAAIQLDSGVEVRYIRLNTKKKQRQTNAFISSLCEYSDPSLRTKSYLD